MREKPQGTSYLYQVYPDLNETGSTFSYKASSNPNYYKDPQNKLLNAFPDVIDVMVRIMTTEGSNSLAAFEDGLIPAPEDKLIIDPVLLFFNKGIESLVK